MANIQQSVNSMLSSAQGAAFLFSQTPFYKNQAEINQLKAQGQRLNKAQEGFQEKEAELLARKPKEGTAEYDKWNEEYATFNREYGKLAQTAGSTATALLQRTGQGKYLEPARVAEDIQTSTAQNVAASQDYAAQREAELQSTEEAQAIYKAETTDAETQRAINAGRKAQSSYNNKSQALRNTIDMVRANRQFLSSKQRGQLETMIHTLDKKGALK